MPIIMGGTGHVASAAAANLLARNKRFLGQPRISFERSIPVSIRTSMMAPTSAT